MITATRALRRTRADGAPLPFIPELEALYLQGTVFRQGQIAMVAGRPGSQKSGLAMWMAAKWALPCLYVSGDMSAFTATTRLAGIYSGLTSDDVAENLKDDATAVAVTNSVADSPIQFMFSSSPSLDDIDEEINAWVEAYDEHPKVIIVDNLIDVEAIAEDEHANLLAILQELKALSRPVATNAFIMAVHHNKVDGKHTHPAPESGIQSKVSQTPELILSVALDQSDPNQAIMRIANVKNRSGPSSSDASRYIELLADPARTSFSARPKYPQGVQQWQS